MDSRWRLLPGCGITTLRGITKKKRVRVTVPDDLLGVGLVAFGLASFLATAVYMSDSDNMLFALVLLTIGTLCLLVLGAGFLYAQLHKKRLRKAMPATFKWRMPIAVAATAVIGIVLWVGSVTGSIVTFVGFCLLGVMAALVTSEAIAKAARGATDRFTGLVRRGRRLAGVVPLGAVLGVVSASTFVAGFAVVDIVGAVWAGEFPVGVPSVLIGAPEWAFWPAYGVVVGSVRGVACVWQELSRWLQTRGDLDKRFETAGRAVVLVCCAVAGILGGWLP